MLELSGSIGTNSIFLAQRGFHVWGVDIARSALRRARERAQQAGVTAGWIEADARKLPFQRASLGLIYDRGCLHWVEGHDRPEYVREIARVLRRSGRYQMIVFTERLQRGELESLFRTGFKVLRLETVWMKDHSGNPHDFYSLFLGRN